jgi:hypothetical protein
MTTLATLSDAVAAYRARYQATYGPIIDALRAEGFSVDNDSNLLCGFAVYGPLNADGDPTVAVYVADPVDSAEQGIGTGWTLTVEPDLTPGWPTVSEHVPAALVPAAVRAALH